MYGHWRDTFGKHVIGLEKYFLISGLADFPGERTVYLAGMLAREFDLEYRKQIQDYIIEDPGELDRTIRKHFQRIGQNAPIITLSRINAEYLTVQLAARALGSIAQTFGIIYSTRYFGVASLYSQLAGKDTQARLYAFMRDHNQTMLSHLTDYLKYVALHWHSLPGKIPPELWKKFGSEINERNRRKDVLDGMRITRKGKNRLSPLELRQMLDDSVGL